MDGHAVYTVRVKGHLGPIASTWFEGFVLEHHPSGETTLTGRVDQPALHAVLIKIRDLNLTLYGVDRAEDVVSGENGTKERQGIG